MNVLFVCTGNTCRSPMAEHLFRKLAKDAGLDVNVSSAGVSPANWSPFPPAAASALSAEGVVGASHQARGLSAGAVAEADVILVMEPSHLSALTGRFSEAAGKTHVLKAYAGAPGPAGVADPYGGSDEDYRRALADIKSALNLIIDKWTRTKPPRRS